jgi:hypothetical protein
MNPRQPNSSSSGLDGSWPRISSGKTSATPPTPSSPSISPSGELGGTWKWGLASARSPSERRVIAGVSSPAARYQPGWTRQIR